MSLISGAIIKKFIENHWTSALGDDWYVESGEGRPLFDDEGRTTFDADVDHDPEDLLWFFQWQGRGEKPPSVVVCGKSIEIDEEGLDSTKVIKAWMSSIDGIQVTVRVPPNKVSELSAWVDKSGGVTLR